MSYTEKHLKHCVDVLLKEDSVWCIGETITRNTLLFSFEEITLFKDTTYWIRRIKQLVLLQCTVIHELDNYISSIGL